MLASGSGKTYSARGMLSVVPKPLSFMLCGEFEASSVTEIDALFLEAAAGVKVG